MENRTRRKRIVKQAPAEDLIIPVKISPNGAVPSCVGCYYFDDVREECDDDGNHNCNGVIFIKKAK